MRTNEMYSESRDLCGQRGGRLASLETVDEADTAQTLITGITDSIVFIGLRTAILPYM